MYRWEITPVEASAERVLGEAGIPNGLFPDDLAAFTAEEMADCLVVGAGISGSTLAHNLNRAGVDVILAEARDYVDETIMEEMVKGRFSPQTRDRYIDLMWRLNRDGAEGIILGCTEIPLLIMQKDIDLPTFATTDLHCQAAVEMALAV